MNIDFQEKAEYYLLGKMTSNETIEFEKLLHENSELQEEFLIISAINKHFSGETSTGDIPQNVYTEKLRVALRSEEAKKIKNEIAKTGNRYKNENKRKNSYFGIAASLIFIIESPPKRAHFAQSLINNSCLDNYMVKLSFLSSLVS